jgi:hypothetical protein
MAGKDFVNVRLTELGRQQAGSGRLQVHAGNHSFYFTPDEVKMVTRAFEWERVLKTEHVNGHPLFEIVPDISELTPEQDAQRLRDLGIDATATPEGIMVETKEVGA